MFLQQFQLMIIWFLTLLLLTTCQKKIQLKCQYKLDSLRLWPQHTYCLVKNTPLTADHCHENFTFIRNSYYTSKTTAVHFQFSGLVEFLPSAIFTEFPNTNGLFLTHSELPVLKSNLFNENFTNLEYLSLESNEIAEIQEHSLDRLINLKWIYFGWNQLTKLTEKIFQFNKKLEYVAFHNNHIKRINPQLLVELNSLQEIWFGKNQCVDQNFGCQFNCTEIPQLHQHLQKCYDNFLNNEDSSSNANKVLPEFDDDYESESEEIPSISVNYDTNFLTTPGTDTEVSESSVETRTFEEILLTKHENLENQLFQNLSDSLKNLYSEQNELYRNLSLLCEVIANTNDYQIKSLKRKLESSMENFTSNFEVKVTTDLEILNKTFGDSLKLLNETCDSELKRYFAANRDLCNSGLLNLNESLIEGQLYYINEIQSLKHESSQNLKIAEQKLASCVTMEEFNKLKNDLLLVAGNSSQSEQNRNSIMELGNRLSDLKNQTKFNGSEFQESLETIKQDLNSCKSSLKEVNQKVDYLEKLMSLQHINQQLSYENYELTKMKDGMEQRIVNLETKLIEDRTEIRKIFESELSDIVKTRLETQRQELESEFSEKLKSQLELFEKIYEQQKSLAERNERALLDEIDRRKLLEENYNREILLAIRQHNEILKSRLKSNEDQQQDEVYEVFDVNKDNLNN